MCAQAWKEILIGASDDAEEQYLLKLINQASKVLKEENDLNPALQNQYPVVETAEGIVSDQHAVDILDRICALVVTDDSEGANSRQGSGRRELQGLHFMRDGNGMWAGSDFGLLVAMLLVNRSGLVHLFFAREGRRDASSMMPNALWACLICRQLSVHKDVGVCSYHLKNGFEVCCPRRPR